MIIVSNRIAELKALDLLEINQRHAEMARQDKAKEDLALQIAVHCIDGEFASAENLINGLGLGKYLEFRENFKLNKESIEESSEDILRYTFHGDKKGVIDFLVSRHGVKVYWNHDRGGMIYKNAMYRWPD